MAFPHIFTASSASNVAFGITNETSMILNSWSRNVQPKKSTIEDAVGNTVAVAYTGVTAAIKLDGFINGSVSMTVGSIITLVNDVSQFGLAAGTVLIDDITESAGKGEFKKISVSCTQYSETMTLHA